MLTIKILSIHLKYSDKTLFTIPFVKKNEKKNEQHKKTLNFDFFFFSQECEWDSGSDPCHGIGVLLPFFDGNQLC